MTTIDHIHYSSLWSTPIGELEKDFDYYMARTDILTVTEVQNDRRSAKLAEKGWKYFAATGVRGGDECAVAWKNSVWKLEWKKALKVSQKTWKRKGNTVAPLHASTVVLRHKQTGFKLLISAMHFPALVEDVWRTPKAAQDARVQTYKRSITNWKKHINQQEMKHKPDGVILTGDWNLDFKKNWVRNYVMSEFKPRGFKLSWKHFPSNGTHYRGRIIDASLFKGMKTKDGSKLVPKRKGKTSDHRGFRTVYTKGKTKVLGPSAGTGPGAKELTGEEEDYPPSGDTKQGIPWWGFGDYDDDTEYQLRMGEPYRGERI